MLSAPKKIKVRLITQMHAFGDDALPVAVIDQIAKSNFLVAQAILKYYASAAVVCEGIPTIVKDTDAKTPIVAAGEAKLKGLFPLSVFTGPFEKLNPKQKIMLCEQGAGMVLVRTGIIKTVYPGFDKSIIPDLKKEEDLLKLIDANLTSAQYEVFFPYAHRIREGMVARYCKEAAKHSGKDEVLLVYGASHRSALEAIFKQHPDFDYVETIGTTDLDVHPAAPMVAPLPPAAPKKISFVFWGELHRDAGSMRLLTDFVRDLHEQKTPAVFCEEDFQGQTLDNKEQGNTAYASAGEQLFQIEFLKPWIKRDRTFPYCDADDFEKIKSAFLRNAFTSLQRDAAEEHALCLIRYPAYRASLQLIQLLKQTKNIPYVGIDFDQAKRALMQKKVVMGEAKHHSYEQPRVFTMIRNMLEQAVPQLTGNGVIIVRVGVDHVHRLAAHLWLLREFIKQCEIQIFAFRVFSSDEIKSTRDHERSEAITRPNDPPMVLAAYPRIQCQQIICQVDKNKVSSADLEKQKAKILAHVQERKNEVKRPQHGTFFVNPEYLKISDWAKIALLSRWHRALAQPKLDRAKSEMIRKLKP